MNSMLDIKSVKQMVPGRHLGDRPAHSGFVGIKLKELEINIWELLAYNWNFKTEVQMNSARKTYLVRSELGVEFKGTNHLR